MEVFQVNISDGGLPKRSVGTAQVTVNGLAGDHHDKESSPDKAILIIPLRLYEALDRESFDLAPGDLGENLTIDGINLKDMEVGQKYRIGPDVEVELTMPRKPGERLQALDDRFPDALQNRGGFYARVLAEGTVAEGDAFEPL
jgi:MOSC domain-containing protein YiiM